MTPWKVPMIGKAVRAWALGLLGGPLVAGVAQQITGRLEAPMVWAAIAMAIAAACWLGGRRYLRG